MGQLSIFDLIQDEKDFKVMTLEEVADYVGGRIGVVFTRSDRTEEYTGLYKGLHLSLSLSHYEGIYDNDGYISASWFIQTEHEGGGKPCDNIEEVIMYFEKQKGKV